MEFTNSVVMITGGTGSFGNAALQRFLDTSVRELRIFSRDEKKQDDMRNNIKDERVKYYLGDVRNYSSIENAMRDVDYVFSAAALKQVPSCEFYPLEAVYTNVLGTDNTLKAATANSTKAVVVLSTDKAVYPINAMGMSKALMEKVAIARSRNLSNTETRICVTRYGNVMASRGSVIPRFISQIRDGLPITVTDPGMTRFMMSLEEAVELVLFALSEGKGGDTLVKKAPSATIGQLARVLKEILNSDVPVEVIGTRHGEKKHETLLNREEMVRAVDLGEYYRITADSRDMNYELYFECGESKVTIEDDYTSANTHQLSDHELYQLLYRLDVVKEALN